MEAANDSDLVKADTASAVTKLNKYYLYRLAAQKKIPCYRAGRALRFNLRELLDWMRSQSQMGEEKP